MTGTDAESTRFPRDGWFRGSGSARFIGGVSALLLVVPLVVGTLLERGIGEVPATVVLVVLALGGLAGVVLLLRGGYRVLALFLACTTTALVVAVVVTVTMDW